ncbi:MAG: 30S ribosomal protein S12 methylthiotransferase RimO [Spirochaetes bacterium]|nr:30S ribosomal protein S12 methylthiotransferase RimO [Spirochaetota bacterium]
MYSPSGISFYLISLGCSKNQTESERINSILSSSGMQYAEKPTDADIIIINTCGFIEDAKKESIEVVFDSLDYKKESTTEFGKKIVVVGCFSQRYYEELKKEIPEADFIYGIIDDNFQNELFDRFNIEKTDVKCSTERKPLVSGSAYEYIKISDGCSNNCSYCAIPLIRGPVVSFSPERILKDASEALERGAVELNIIAQDIAVYSYGKLKLPGLLRKISELDGDFKIRLLYCHPDNITDEIISEIAQNGKIVPYIDVPFQHVSENILKSMNRRGNFGKYSDLAAKLREKIPGLVIRSTFMVGYPGETEENFEELLAFLQQVKLDKVGCFIYSPEEGTASYELENVEQKVKKTRYRKLMKLQQKISTEKLHSMIGQKVEVIVEEKVDEANYIGRSVYDAPEVDGVFYLTGRNITLNTIVTAQITDSVEYDLIGEI